MGLVLVEIEGRGRQKATNKSLRLVGGLFLAGIEGVGRWMEVVLGGIEGGGR